MKRNELKQILKPLIKECIKEALFEEGILSNIVSEVVKGLGTNTIVEQRAPAISKPIVNEQREREYVRTQASDTRKQLLDAIGKDSYNGVNLFEGTEPLRQAAASSGISSSPLSNVDPGDAGVSIEGILAVGGSKWKALMGK